MEIAELIPFDCRGHTIRVAFLGDDGEPWFVARDVCALLKLAKPRKAVAALRWKERRRVEFFDESILDYRKTTVIDELGVCDLIFKSQPTLELYDWFCEVFFR